MAVDPFIQKKADFIRGSKKGLEVRDSLASGLEAMSEVVVDNTGRQTDVETQFQEVIDSTTNKDVVSAPEIIAARAGKPNLKDRLDAEHSEVTAQLGQTENQIGDISALKTVENNSLTEALNGMKGRSTTAYGFDIEEKMKNLYKELSNPFIFKLGMVLIGDSITWGSGSTQKSPYQPRNGTYTDVKNNMVNNSWANLLHKYIGKSFFGETAEQADKTTEGTIIYSKEYNLGFDESPYVTHGGEIETRFTSTTLLGAQYFMPINSYIEFNVVGDEINLNYSSTSSTSDYELFIDDVSKGTFSTSGSASYTNVRKHVFDFGSHKIKIKNVSLSGVLRLEGLSVKKEFIYKNAGIIGSSSDDWQKGNAKGLYDHAFSPYDRHTIIQLGTNDRTKDGWSEPNSPSSSMRLISSIINDIKTDKPNISIYISCANDVGHDESDRAFTMKEVRDLNSNVAVFNNLPFIDNYSATLEFDKNLILDDGLHPNDAGYYIMARNFIGNLFTNI